MGGLATRKKSDISEEPRRSIIPPRPVEVTLKVAVAGDKDGVREYFTRCFATYHDPDFDKYLHRIGTRVDKRVVKTGKHEVTFMLWDICDEKASGHKDLPEIYLRGSAGVFVVVNAGSDNIVDEVKKWLGRLEGEAAVKKLPPSTGKGTKQLAGKTVKGIPVSVAIMQPAAVSNERVDEQLDKISAEFGDRVEVWVLPLIGDAEKANEEALKALFYRSEKKELPALPPATG